MAKWEQGSLNEVYVEGLLSEVKLTEDTTDPTNPVIKGEYRIKTKNTINGVDIPQDIPVRVYASKLTKNKKDNPSYTSMKTLMTDFVSIAAGGEDKADAVRLSERSTSLQENFFMPKGGQNMVFSSGIRASFINKISRADMVPQARFKTVIVVGDFIDELNSEGEETGRLIIKGVIPTYGGKADVIDYIVENANVANVIRNNWSKGDTVLIGGYLNYTSVTEIASSSGNSFGEVMESKRTKSVKEYIVTGGNENPLDEEQAYVQEDVAAALEERQTRINAAKEKSKETEKKNKPVSFGF